MQRTKKILLVLTVVALMSSLFAVNANAACAHSSLGVQYSEGSHPHAYFKYCTACGEKVYTGGYATKAHGNGAWGSGTCPSCGTHTYKLASVSASLAPHPHTERYECSCGSSYSRSYLQLSCSQCKKNSQVAHSSTPTQGVLVFSSEMIAPVAVTLYVNYSNTYNHPAQNEPSAFNGIAFASYLSSVVPSAEVPPNLPTIYCIADRTVTYHSKTGSTLLTQEMQFSTGGNVANKHEVFLSENPSYTISWATCHFEGSGQMLRGSTKTYFS